MSDTWKGKQILVTGADGFIGSHLVEKLLELGACLASTECGPTELKS